MIDDSPTPKSRKRSFLFAGIVAAVAVLLATAAIGGTVLGTTARTTSARAAFRASMTRLSAEVKADGKAHAALAAARESTFPASATKVNALVASCVDPTTTAQTTSELKQLASFASQPGGTPVVSRSLDPKDTANAYVRAKVRVDALLKADKYQTVLTKAATASDLIATSEVNADLAATAQSVVNENKVVTAKYVYAAAISLSAYQKAVQNVGAQVTALASRPASKLISPTESTTLVTTLTAYGNACASVAASSKANTPVPVVTAAYSSDRSAHRAPRLIPPVLLPPFGGAPPFSVHFLTNVNYSPGCTPTRTLLAGVENGMIGTSHTIDLTGISGPYRYYTTQVNENTVDWAVDSCF